jgi:hypothetical protein
VENTFQNSSNEYLLMTQGTSLPVPTAQRTLVSVKLHVTGATHGEQQIDIPAEVQERQKLINYETHAFLCLNVWTKRPV